jgi:phosphoserine phosphatase
MTLVAFDFDGTLSDSEMTVLLGEQAGVADEIADVTKRAMNDEIGYAESLRQRAALLDGLPETAVADAWAAVELREGAADLLESLRDAGVTTVIFTGGFESGVQDALDRADVAVDAIVANRLPIEDGALTGGVEGPLLEGTKDDALREYASEHDVDLTETIAVGDGANDLPMLDVAGIAIGFDPKPAVEPHCDVTVDSMQELRSVFEDEGVL